MPTFPKSFSLTEQDLEKLKAFQAQNGLRSLSQALSSCLQQLGQQAVTVSHLTRETTIVTVPDLPGMTEAIVKSHRIRWDLSQAEYDGIVAEVVRQFASTGTQIKNPEAAIFGACRRYANDRTPQPKAEKKAATAKTQSAADIAALQEAMM